MENSRPVIGDWKGTMYHIGGDRTDWQLSLWRSGQYVRTLSSREPKREKGVWELIEDGKVLSLTPDSGESSRWSIRDVTGLEGAATLLVLRWSALASRNLPILLYRIHPLPGPPLPLDAHGFDSIGPFPTISD
jgi:hypothetical protein